MTVFKTFWKIINKYKGTIILYTVMLVIFGGINMSSNNNTVEFTSSKPDIIIVNEDEYKGITKNLIDYLKDNANIIQDVNTEDEMNDSLFYRETNYIIYIPKNYRVDTLNGKSITLNIKSSGDYYSSLEELKLTQYLSVQNTYLSVFNNEEDLISNINNTLKNNSKVEVTSKLNESELSNISRYFSFASYSIMAVIMFIICLVLTSFKETTINKRIIISSMDYKEHNKLLFISSLGYSLIVFVLYVVLGIILLGKPLLTTRGLIYILNTFVFTITCLSLSLLICSLIKSKDAVNGIVNVLALGSAFLCGAFVPSEWLPDGVLLLGHIFPAYYFINSNDLLKEIQVLNLNSLMPVIINMIILLGFTFVFVMCNNIVTKKKRVS